MTDLGSRLPLHFNHLRWVRGHLVDVLFGDRFGILVFLGALIYFGIYWRIDFFITDNWTIANTFVALSEGQLYVDRTIYGPSQARTPGYNIVDGRFYGRNYGQLFLSLPALYLLQAISFIADLRIAIAAGWSLLVLGFARRVGAEFGDRHIYVLLGSFIALVTFSVNTAFAIPIEPRLIYLSAMQITTMVFAALIGVFVYRLLTAVHNRRVGLFTGVVTVLATPVAFWASIPKRHILVSLLALIALYAFYISRETNSDVTALRTRCLAYASVGIWAWVHAPEALAMFVVLVPMDLATSRSNDWSDLGAIGATFMLSLLPFGITNYLISGNPFRPPRFISSGGSTGVGSPAAPGGLVSAIFTELSPVLSPLLTLLELFASGLSVVFTEPQRVLATFLRSAPEATRATSTDLTILESTPIFGVFIVLPFLLYYWKGAVDSRSSPLWTPVRQADVFAVAFVISLTLLYMSRLPLHAMWTVRYLLPIIPFGMYLLGRLSPVRQVIACEDRLMAFSYAGIVLIGGQLLVVYLVTLAPSRGEIMQFHGLVGIVTAVIAALWSLTVVIDDFDDSRIGAIALALPVAVGTLFVLLTGIEYFAVGDFALGMTRMLSNAIPLF